MGGGGGGSHSIGNIQQLVDRAKKELREGKQESKRNVFISFAYEDNNEVTLLRGQAKNENSPIEFNDWSVSESFNSERASYIRKKIEERINHSSATVVYLSDAACKSKWVKWEIEESIKQGKQVIGIYSKDSKPKVVPEAINTHNIKCVPWSELAKTLKNIK